MKKCQNCETVLSNDDKFCPNCGTKVEEVVAEQASSVVAEAVKETTEQAAMNIEDHFKETASEVEGNGVELADLKNVDQYAFLYEDDGKRKSNTLIILICALLGLLVIFACGYALWSSSNNSNYVVENGLRIGETGVGYFTVPEDFQDLAELDSTYDVVDVIYYSDLQTYYLQAAVYYPDEFEEYDIYDNLDDELNYLKAYFSAAEGSESVVSMSVGELEVAGQEARSVYVIYDDGTCLCDYVFYDKYGNFHEVSVASIEGSATAEDTQAFGDALIKSFGADK